MPVPTAFGVYASGSTAAPGGLFVGAGSAASAGGGTESVDFAADGAQAGDIALVNAWTPGGTNNTTAAGWTRSTYTWSTSGYTGVWLWKVLAAGDISSPVSFTGVPSSAGQTALQWVIFRGPTTATQRSTALSTGTSVTIPGFTKSVSALALATFLNSRPDNADPTPPTGFSRETLQSLGFFGSVAAAILSDPDTYTNGASQIWANVAASSPGNMGGTWEFT